MKRLTTIFLTLVLIVSGFVAAPMFMLSDIQTKDGSTGPDTFGPIANMENDAASDTASDLVGPEPDTKSRSDASSRALNYKAEDFADQNVFYLISESIDTVPSGRYLDGIPRLSDGRDTKLNKADLHLPDSGTTPPRTGYEDGNRMYFRFPRNPGLKFDANFNESFATSPIINITFNTLQVAGKEVNIEILIDANGDFDANSPNMANIEGIITFPMYTTNRPAPSDDIQMEETFVSNGTWADSAFIPKQIRNGAIYVSIWRSDLLFDPEVPFLPDLLIYAGFTNKTSWIAIPYEHTVALPIAHAAYDYEKDSVHKWFGIKEPPSKDMVYEDVPEWMKMKPFDTIVFNASRSYDPNDDFNSNKNIDDGIPPPEVPMADEQDSLQYKWSFGDGTNSGWMGTPMTQHKYQMDPTVREKNYTVVLQIRNRGFHVVSDSCWIRIFNEEHPPEINSVQILPQSVDPNFGTFGPRAVVNQEVQFTGFAEDKDPWDLNDLRYQWDLNGDGKVDESGQTVTFKYSTRGSRDITLWVHDGEPGNSSTFTTSLEKPLFISDNVKPVPEMLAAKVGEIPVRKELTAQFNEPIIFNTSLCYDPDNLPGYDVNNPKDFVQDHNLSFIWHWNWERENASYAAQIDPYSEETLISARTFNITTSHMFTESDYILGSNYKVYVWLEIDDGSDTVNSYQADEPDVFIITLNRKPVADFLINNRTEVQQIAGLVIGKQINFDGSPSYDPNDDENNDGVILQPEVDRLSYSWSFDDSNVDISGKTITHAFAKYGNHRITLTVSDGELTAVKVRNIFIDENPEPPIAVVKIPVTTGPTFFPFSFKGSDSYDIDPNDDVVKWTWDFGDGDSSIDADTTHSYQKEGLYQITLTVTDKAGLTGQNANFSVVVFNRDPFVVLHLINEGKKNLPIKMSATATDPDGYIVGYFWDFGDGKTLPESGEGWTNISKPNKEWSLPDGVDSKTYTVTVRVIDDAGKMNVSSSNIKIIYKRDVDPEEEDAFISTDALFYIVIGIVAAVIVVAIVIIAIRIRREAF